MGYFIGVDPGKTIGVAWWHPLSEEFAAMQTKHPYEAMRLIEQVIYMANGNVHATVEKFSGGGYSTSDGIYTTELVGWFTYHLGYHHNLPVRNALSQQRLSGMDRVKELIAGKDIPGPHSHDALAHAIVHARTLA